MIAEKTDEREQIGLSEYLDQIPNEVSLEQVEKDMKVKIKKDLDVEYIKSRLACLIILSNEQVTQKSGNLERFILNQLEHGEIVKTGPPSLVTLK